MHGQLKQAKKTFTANAKTFSLAARFLSQARYEAIARLYAFCRQLDDLADADPAGCNHEQLLQIREDLCRDNSDDRVVADMLRLQRTFKIPTTLLLDFIDALIVDQYARQLNSLDELVRFSYGVASTVGLMMCHVFGVRDPRAFPFAVDLGVAMQISNISRDILEDAERGRIYIPAQLLDGPVSCQGLIDGDATERAAAYAGACKLVSIADDYYASAAQGFGYLPRTVRHAITIAARLYRAIGEKVVASPDEYWQRRTIVKKRTKFALISQLLLQRLRDGSSTLLIGKVSHRPQLHKALDHRRFTA